MKKIDMLTEEFKSKYERFFIGCDAIEKMGLWDKEEYGEMEIFYQNDLLGIILNLITADGKIKNKEKDYLNENFGFDYTVNELADVYENCKENIGPLFFEQFKKGISVMTGINEKLANAYKELLSLICDIIIESDSLISSEEIERVKIIKDTIH